MGGKTVKSKRAFGALALQDRATSGTTPEKRRFRHVKSGTTYVLVGVGELQSSGPIEEGHKVVVYQSEGGARIWFRPVDEFDDGRFEELPPVARATRQPKPDPGEGELNYYRAEGTGDTICIRCEFNLSTYLRERIDAAVRAERQEITDELFRLKFKLEAEASDLHSGGAIGNVSELVRIEQAFGIHTAIEAIRARATASEPAKEGK